MTMWGSDIRPHREVYLRLGEAQTGLQQGQSRVQSEFWVLGCHFLPRVVISCLVKTSPQTLLWGQQLGQARTT